MNATAVPPTLRAELTVAQAADVLNRTPSTVYRWIDEGYLRADRRPKNQVVIRREYVLDVMRRME